MGDRRRLAAVVVAVLAGLASAGPATAQSVSATQLQDLAGRAVDDPRALAQVRAVQQVDGRPVDVERLLDGAAGPALASRLRTLAAGGGSAGPAPDASAARHDAEAVLHGRRFRPSRVPRPLAGVLTTLGRWMKPVVEPFGRLWAGVAESVGAQLVLVGLVFLGASVISLRLIGRRSPRSLARSRPVGAGAEGLDPEELEREAAVAEGAGDLDRAVRLRFVAGVLRLDRAGVISYQSSLTTGQIQARLQSGSFAELAVAFDEIAYGGRPAAESDVRQATATWPRVLAEAQR